MNRRVNILGVFIDKIDLQQAEESIAQFVSSNEPHQIVTVNLDFISIALRNLQFKELINSSSLVVADGMPVIWASRALGDPLPQRITGTDLVNICCTIGQENGQGVFLLGAEPGVALGAARILLRQYPDLRIAGTYSPPFGEFTPDENERMVDMITSSGATYLFVAFGCPKQDQWIRKHMLELGVPVCIGVGGIFNYLTGRVKRAPVWVQNVGFEWFYRMVQQPQLTRRYLINDLPVFVRALGYRPSSAEMLDLAMSQTEGRTFHQSTGIEQIVSGKR